MEMRGFKSFANKTELLFGNKFNCILGPNGSGKSNVLDSLVFVLGKAGAKSLRAEKTANLVYNGGKTKQAAKEGEVTIFFDNTSGVFGNSFGEPGGKSVSIGAELKITRIIKDDGTSVYKMNDAKCTRQEIVEMLEKAQIDPDGHNIILQGDIIHLIEMTGIERRQIIEEIAGIGVYEDKKQKALGELARVEQKLNETDIILVERKTYLKELKSERDQALQFKELQDKLKRNKKTILSKKIAKREKEIKDYEARAKKNQDEIAKAAGQVEELRKQITEQKAEIDRINAEVESRGAKDQVAIHKQVETLKVDLAVKKQRLETVKQELEKVKARREELMKANKELFDKIKFIEEEKRELQESIVQTNKDLAATDLRIAEFKKKHNVEDASKIDTEIAEIDKKAEVLQEDLGKLREEQQGMLREKDRTDVRIEQADEKIAKVVEAEKGNKAQLDKLKSKQDAFKQATKELQQALAEDANLAGALSSARTAVGRITDELTKLQAQNASIKEGAAGGIAIQKVLEQKQKIKGIVGTVAELGSVKQEHQLALEIAAGGRITGIVVEDDKTASECIAFLRQGQHGVATFLPMNKLKAPEPDPNIGKLKATPGVIGVATELITYDHRFDVVFRYVFGNTLVVDSLDTARKIGVGRVRMVTLSGDMVETSGAMQGGFRARGRVGMGFQQKEVTEKIARLEKELADNESVVARAEQKRRDNEQLIERLREHKANLEAEIITLEKTLHLDSQDLDLNKEEKKRLAQESKQLEAKIDDIIMRISTANRELASLKVRKQQLRDQITALRSPQVLAQLTSFEEKRQAVKDQIEEFRLKIKADDAQIASVLGPETERIQNILKQQDRESAQFAKETDDTARDLKRIEQELAEREEAERKFMQQFKELFAKRQKAADAIHKLETEVEKLQSQSKDLEAKNTGYAMELARIKAELAGLQEEDLQYQGIEPFEEKKDEDCMVEIREFERMLANIGAVNMKALEIYETVEREYNELVQKKDKLGLERQDVLLLIAEIDGKKKDIFMKSFNSLNDNFKRIFLSLSAKGEAYIEIDDEKDLFNNGISIKVKLSGNKFMDIRSLSGGEKTMTALAFLFAVQEYNPASFYIMDEVDAALDKHNSEKLAKLVRAYCTRAQYIVISHNDSVISEADTLFGVSMNEHGISKVTSLKI
jgi:chromosome segregation protein